jgi:hypothetical protein
VKRIRFIVSSTDTESPREWDNLGIMACWHGRYTLGDEQPTVDPDEWVKNLPDGSVVLPLYLFDHSGITISTEPFGDPWDSGPVGYIAATPETIAMIGTPPEHIEACLRSEVKIYDQFLRGDVFGYVIEEGHKCGECGHEEWKHVDSCFGFFGSDLEKSGALENIDEELHEAAKVAFLTPEFV